MLIGWVLFFRKKFKPFLRLLALPILNIVLWIISVVLVFVVAGV